MAAAPATVIAAGVLGIAADPFAVCASASVVVAELAAECVWFLGVLVAEKVSEMSQENAPELQTEGTNVLRVLARVPTSPFCHFLLPARLALAWRQMAQARGSRHALAGARPGTSCAHAPLLCCP